MLRLKLRRLRKRLQRIQQLREPAGDSFQTLRQGLSAGGCWVVLRVSMALLCLVL